MNLLDNKTDQEQFECWRAEDRHESALLANRVGSYLASQAMFMSMYFVSANLKPITLHGWISFTFALLAVVLTVCAGVSIYAGVGVLDKLHERARERAKTSLVFFESFKPDLTRDVHMRAMLFPKALPLVMGPAWVALAVVAFFLSH